MCIRDRVNGGTVHFKGEVVNAACAVDAGSVDQTVQLGQVRTASLKQAGATSSAVGFNIQLNDCDTTVATKAAVAFLGTAIDATHTDVLAVSYTHLFINQRYLFNYLFYM